jgi:hypothetical protein
MKDIRITRQRQCKTIGISASGLWWTEIDACCYSKHIDVESNVVLRATHTSLYEYSKVAF